MKPIALFIFSFFILGYAPANPPQGRGSKTLSGIPYNSDLIFHIKRICIAKPITSNSFVLPIEPSLEIGAFRAEYDLDLKTVDKRLNAIDTFRRVEFTKNVKKVNKRSFGAKEYLFEDYTIKVPFEDLEQAMSAIRRPQANNRIVRLLDGASSSAKDRQIQLAGFYVKIENVRSFVAFDGSNSNVSSDLKAKEDETFLVYERLWPKFATLLGTSRSIRSAANSHISHLEPRSDCSTSTNFEYTVEVSERSPTTPASPARRKSGLQ